MKNLFTVLLLFFCLSLFAQKDLKLLLPPVIYAVQGHELNVYFDNIILCPESALLKYKVSASVNTAATEWAERLNSSLGRQDAARWRITAKNQSGSYKWSIKITDGTGNVLAADSTTLKILPKKSFKNKKLTLLVIGDSLTNAAIYPAELKRLLEADGIKVKMIGSHSGSGRKAGIKGIALEGYGGWKWGDFLSLWEKENKNYRSRSKFLFLKNGKPQLDFKKYFTDKKAYPDYVTIMLGINDVFQATDATRESSIDSILKNADKFLGALRKASPKSKIAIALIPPPASSQDAFGSNYKSVFDRWNYRKSQHRLVERYIQHFKGREKDNIFLVPVYLNIDCVNNYPMRLEKLNARNEKQIMRQCNGVHPAKSGYLQIADSFYFWFVSQLTDKGGK